MRHRITYLRKPGSDQAPNELEVTKKALELSGFRGAKEHQVTFGLSELPPELKQLVDKSDEIHIRWSSPRSQVGYGPFVSALSPGLHVFQTPKNAGKTSPAQTVDICPNLRTLFGPAVRCSGKADQTSFTSPPKASQRFARSASGQLYYYLDSLKHLQDYMLRHICKASDQECVVAAKSLLSATSLDVDHDHISGAVIVKAYWDKAPARFWSETIDKEQLRSDSVEVGLLNEEETKSKEEIKVGGTLTVVGQDDKAKGTLFGFPSRHHRVRDSGFWAKLDAPTGLHPTLRLGVDVQNTSAPTTWDPTCSLHAYMTLPSQLFVDRYAFRDALFFDSHNLRALRSISGATDLEAPDWAIAQWGSASLFELKGLKASEQSLEGHLQTEVTIPLHARYLPPTPGGYADMILPYPVVFYACGAKDEDLPPLSTNPFDRTNLGYDGLFGERTLFYHLTPNANGVSSKVDADYTVLSYTVPVLDMDGAKYIEPVTIGVILLGCLWLCWKLLGPLPKLNADSKKTESSTAPADGKAKKIR